MRSPEAMERHLQVAPAHDTPAGRISLLRASVTARLGLVAVAAGLLWLAVLWALS
jgi:hypothetical protein